MFSYQIALISDLLLVVMFATAPMRATAIAIARLFADGGGDAPAMAMRVGLLISATATVTAAESGDALSACTAQDQAGIAFPTACGVVEFFTDRLNQAPTATVPAFDPPGASPNGRAQLIFNYRVDSHAFGRPSLQMLWRSARA